jgi:hypothetical protein
MKNFLCENVCHHHSISGQLWYYKLFKSCQFITVRCSIIYCNSPYEYFLVLKVLVLNVQYTRCALRYCRQHLSRSWAGSANYNPYRVLWALTFKWITNCWLLPNWTYTFQNTKCLFCFKNNALETASSGVGFSARDLVKFHRSTAGFLKACGVLDINVIYCSRSIYIRWRKFMHALIREWECQ